MTDGDYLPELEVAGHVRSAGWLSVLEHTLKGGNETYSVRGSIAANPALSARLEMDLLPSTEGHQGVSGRFAMTATGHSSNGRFTMLGIGPLGAIIEMRGTRID